MGPRMMVEVVVQVQDRSDRFWTPTVMSTVLPGTQVSAQHVNLKLGPGLLQMSDAKAAGSSIITTRAGVLNHSANKSKWWVESNSRRVCVQAYDTLEDLADQHNFSMFLLPKNL